MEMPNHSFLNFVLLDTFPLHENLTMRTSREFSIKRQPDNRVQVQIPRFAKLRGIPYRDIARKAVEIVESVWRYTSYLRISTIKRVNPRYR